MSEHDDEIFNLFLEESREQLATIEEDIVALETQGSTIDDELINRVFRAIHTLKGSASFFSLHNIKELAHVMENLLSLIRNREMICTSESSSLLLEGADILKAMLDNIDSVSSFDPGPLIGRLSRIIAKDQNVASQTSVSPGNSDMKSGGCVAELSVNKDLLFTLQQCDRAGRYTYSIRWNLDSGKLESGKSVLEIIQELLKYGAIAPLTIQSSAEEDCFKRSIQISVVYSTAVDPDLFFDTFAFDKENVQVISDQLITNKKTVGSSPSVEPIPVDPTSTESSISAPIPSEKQDQHYTSKSRNESSSIRVNLEQLDKLMSMAGELVLARNALLRKVSDQENTYLSSITQQIDNITSELQEAIMATRMQSVGIIFTKFKRVVRDLAHTLNKKIELSIEGDDVELDKTIIEALNDPLTHLVRNSADHGIENPAQRIAAGKSESGHLSLTARHETGHVIIEIIDDGAGIDPERILRKALEKKIISKEEAATLSDREIMRLIFKPGFSTAEKVTEVSGRGVGLDVVLSNLTKVGGAVDIESQVGKGTRIILKLPLTLAIIPSILVSVGSQRFAIPQLNVVELVRISAADVKRRIERIGESAVIRLRGMLVPLVRLADVLKIENTFSDKETGNVQEDRRKRIADRRSRSADSEPAQMEHIETDSRVQNDRRKSRSSAVNIIIVTSGVQRFGLIIDQFLDSEEIVVKPIGSHLAECVEYAGATILGDGSVAFILNIAGISAAADLTHMQQEIETIEARKSNGVDFSRDAQTYLVIRNNSEEQFAIPLGVISRIERVKAEAIASLAGQHALSYGESTLALLSIEKVLDVKPRTPAKDVFVIVFRAYGRDVGVMVSQIVDIVDLSSNIDISTYVRPGILGSVIINKTISLILDLHAFVDISLPEYKTASLKIAKNSKKVLIVEDSPFFLRQLKNILIDNECEVISATNGIEGLEALQSNADSIGLCFTDIEMPVMDGIEMAKKIRADVRFRDLPVIAVTSLSGDSAEKRAREAGISEYLIKLDREQIVDRCKQYLSAV